MADEEEASSEERRKSERFRNSNTAHRMNKDIDDLVQARMKNIMPELSVSLTKVMWVMVFAMLLLWNSVNTMEETVKHAGESTRVLLEAMSKNYAVEYKKRNQGVTDGSAK